MSQWVNASYPGGSKFINLARAIKMERTEKGQTVITFGLGIIEHVNESPLQLIQQLKTT